ncbi:hypothetical protein D3C85_101300 [compost metagenome]
MSSKISESMEAIAFQKNSELPKKITALFYKAQQNIDDPHAVRQFLAEITMLFKEATGVWMEATYVEELNFAESYRIECHIPNLNAVSPINLEALKRIEKYDFSNLTGAQLVTGTVDLKNGKVTGFFTKLRNDMEMSKSMLEGLFEPEELTALYFHEGGHAWTNYEFMCETLRTNIILAEVVGAIRPEVELEKRILIGKAALKLAAMDPKVLPKDADPAEITALVLQGQVVRMQEKAGTRWYDKRLAEAVADQFAARWGLGAPLVRAIAKRERARGVFARSGFDAKWVGLLSNGLQIVGLPFKVLSEAGRAAFAIASIWGVAKTFSINLIFTSGLGMLDGGNYPQPEQRIAMIRRELVTLLKDPKLDKQTRLSALEDLKVIDDEISQIHGFGDVIRKLGAFTYEMIRGIRQDYASNDLKEDLANNRLYELSASLKGNS